MWFLGMFLGLSLGLLGCSTFAPPTADHNPQPWAQRESWESSAGLPGFSQSEYDY